MNQQVELLDWFHLENRLACMSAWTINSHFLKELWVIISTRYCQLSWFHLNHLHAFTVDKMSVNRNSYTNEFKKQTNEETKGENLAQFCRQNKLELRTVRRWIHKYEQIAYRCESGDAKKRRTGSGRQTVNVDLENAKSIKKMMFLNF